MLVAVHKRKGKKSREKEDLKEGKKGSIALIIPFDKKLRPSRLLVGGLTRLA
jgi:hypothetical protein